MGWRVIVPAMNKFTVSTGSEDAAAATEGAAGTAVVPAAAAAGSVSVLHRIWKYVIYDLFERRISAVVRMTRRMSRAVPGNLQPKVCSSSLLV